MTSELLPVKVSKTRPTTANEPPSGTLGLKLFDALLILAFLSLTFLLGVFPLKDTDFWWHLKTGDTIRQTGVIPTVDTYSFMAEGRPWIDLHWLFQVAISTVYERGGVPALNLAKCAVTTLAVFLLITARRRDWPYWVIVAAWLPALLVLSGRMYVRPETLTLLYLSIFLAVLMRIDRFPLLAFLLPIVQVAWVNTQGLFVLGPILYGFALIDGILRPGSLSKERSRWWKIVMAAGVGVGLACLVNPYGLTGALYPLQLAGTMGNAVFTNSIAELTPVPLFIKREGLVSLPFRIQLFTMLLGALSFLLPMGWIVARRILGPKTETEAVQTAANKPAKVSKRVTRAKSKGKVKRAEAVDDGTTWRPSLFRILLFGAFSYLSWQATRNSHQFAAAVGSLTAWNFAEWAAVRIKAGQTPPSRRSLIVPRIVSLAMVVSIIGWVASGGYYAAAREGRTIGLGEEPLWYPKEAIKFAGIEGMPDRFAGFHNGHPSLYEYDHAPERKIFVDARLEVMGPDLYERYLNLQRRIIENDPSWPRELDELRRPSVLADHENASISATLMTHPDWRCVWFDSIASLFVHKSYKSIVDAHAIDFGTRHFKPVASEEPNGTAALLASAKGIRSIASQLSRYGTVKSRPLILLGLDYARRLTQGDPDNVDAWKINGQLEMLREPSWSEPIPRFRLPFDPVFDLSVVRQTYAFKHALRQAPDDFIALLLISGAYESRLMNEAALPYLDRLVELTPINNLQREGINSAIEQRKGLISGLGPLQAPPRWQNLKELSEIVNGLLSHGRAETAAVYLEKATAVDSRTWEEADRIATLWLHLGDPSRARSVWQSVKRPSRPGIKLARVGLTHLVEGNFAQARDAYQAAVAADPDFFEAHYVLAILEQDNGRAPEALTSARRASALATTDVEKSAVQSILSFVTPYATSPIAKASAD